MKKLIVFMFSIVLLGSCNKCYKCESTQLMTGKQTTDFCRSDFASNKEMRETIEIIENNPIVDSSGNVLVGAGYMKCRRKLF